MGQRALRHSGGSEAPGLRAHSAGVGVAPTLRTKILDVRGFYSSRI